MLARYEVRIFQNGVRLRSDEKGRSVGHGRTLIIILTAVYLLWLFVRIISQPEWLAQLPVSFLELLRLAEEAIIDAIDAIVAAQEAGATDEQLEQARYLHRQASLRWDFISSENSTGFHSPQEAARVLALSIDYARQAQLEAERLTAGN